MPLLSFTSRSQLFVAPPNAQLHEGVLDGVRVAEIVEPADGEGLPFGTYNYHLLITADVRTLAEAAQTRNVVESLIEDLEQVWPYVAGLPIRPIRTYLAIQYSPDGWTSNYEEVETDLRAQEQGIRATLQIDTRHWMQAPYFPLQRAFDALPAFRGAQPVIRALIELHYNSMTSVRSDGRLFLLAKALELVRALLPGADLRAKSASVAQEVQGELSRSLAWLYDMSNHRLDVRHVVRDARGPDLHPPMTADELRDFEHDADMIIRGVVSQQLELEVAIIRTGPSPAA